MTDKIQITIARQYGSGGRMVGEKLAELLGFRYVDRELVTLAAQKSGYDPEILSRADEKSAGSLLYTLAMGSNMYGVHGGAQLEMPLNDKLFIVQSEIIKSEADKESCVFVGRCADYVLAEYPGRISVFLYASKDARIKRVAQEHGLSEKEASETINKTDKRRAGYYNFYTGGRWGDFENYHLMLDTSVLGTDKTAEIIAQYVRSKKM
ncbi:MAG: cytidylate kinase-like family protein [Clostridia bacterium]|nr:cytidylate kinase-like family protein [Clostridia bacterium]